MKIEIDKLLEERMEEILQGTAEIVAETSVGYFQDTFRHNYARVHNEGFKGAVAVPAHIRHTRRGDQSVRQYTRRVNIPRRQFIGDARELETELQKRIETYVESVLNN